MKQNEKKEEVEMREIAEPKPYNARHTRNLFLAGMSVLTFIIGAVLLYVLFSIV